MTDPGPGLPTLASPLGTAGTTAAWVSGALVIAVATAVVLAFVLWRERRSLRAMAATVRELAAGNLAARASPTAPAPVSGVARAVNTLAEESQRLQAEEAASRQLRAMARAVGFRIREHLRVEDVLEEARVAIEQTMDWPRGGRSFYFRDPAGNSLELATPKIWGLPEVAPPGA